MPRLRARFHFRVHRLLIDAALLGTSHELASEPGDVVLTLPTSAATRNEPGEDHLIAEAFPAEEPGPRTIGGFAMALMRVAPSEEIVRVELVRVDVFVSADISAAAFEDDEHSDWTAVQDPAYELLHDALGTAQRAAGQLLDWVRVAGNQHWLGLSGLEPEPVGAAELVDMDTFARIPVNLSTTRTVFRQVAESQILDSSLLPVLAASAHAGRPSLARSLLADAAYYAWDADPPDSDRAILIAAIACEIRVKDALRAGGEGVSAGLIDLLLDHPRDWSMAAGALWHKPMQVVYGRSLSDETPAIFQEIQRVFNRRNRIAHRGERFGNAAATESVRAASSAFKWLEDISPAKPSDEGGTG